MNNRTTVVRVALGIEKKKCSTCRWLVPRGKEVIKKVDHTLTFCRQPDWLAGSPKNDCGGDNTEYKDWEPRSPRQVPIAEDYDPLK